jgi:hypothetical protein
MEVNILRALWATPGTSSTRCASPVLWRDCRYVK